MYKILQQDEYNKFEEFVRQNPKGHFMQSIKWGKVKQEWKNEIVVSINENNEIIGGINILVRKLPYVGFSIMYAPRGPVSDIYDENVWKDLVDGIKELAKKHKTFILRVDPDVKSDDNKFREIILKSGFIIKDNIKKFSEVIQPRYVFRMNIEGKTEDELLASFHEKTRYNIRLAIKKGVEVKEGTREDIKVFHEIMKETGARDRFGIRPLSYFEKMYDELSPDNIKILIAYFEGKPIAGTIPIIYGDKVWYLYGASSNAYRNVMPNYLLQWEMIKIALKNKARVYDFRGVEEFEDETKPEYGVYKFKKGFNGEFTEFIGEIQIVFNPFINWSFEKIVRIIKKIKFRNLK